jgi:hypothetical protein
MMRTPLRNNYPWLYVICNEFGVSPIIFRSRFHRNYAQLSASALPPQVRARASMILLQRSLAIGIILSPQISHLQRNFCKEKYKSFLRGRELIAKSNILQPSLKLHFPWRGFPSRAASWGNTNKIAYTSREHSTFSITRMLSAHSADISYNSGRVL